MNLEKESKMLEQGIIVWLLAVAVVLIVWGAVFAAGVYILKFTKISPEWLWAACAATVIAAGFVSAVKKFLWK